MLLLLFFLVPLEQLRVVMPPVPAPVIARDYFHLFFLGALLLYAAEVCWSSVLRLFLLDICVLHHRTGQVLVFQYCVTRYLIVWPFLGALPFSTVLQSECKRSRSRKARQSFYNLLKIVFHTWLVYYQVPLMIGEIPISDAYHYMDAHDTETVYSDPTWLGTMLF